MNIVEYLSHVEFTSPKWVLVVPSILMLFDFLTGFVNAWAQHNIKSAKMRSGLAKKIGELAIIGAVEIIVYTTNTPRPALTFTASWVILMEFISIVENTSHSGFKIPKWIAEKLNLIENEVDKHD